MRGRLQKQSLQWIVWNKFSLCKLRFSGTAWNHSSARCEIIFQKLFIPSCCFQSQHPLLVSCVVVWPIINLWFADVHCKLDIWCKIWKKVTIHNSFATDLGIDTSMNHNHYPSMNIELYHSLPMLDSLFSESKVTFYSINCNIVVKGLCRHNLWMST